jgi:hypothetical protein
MSQNSQSFQGLVDELNALLRLKTTVTAMKLFERVEDMQAVPKIRRPKAVHTTDQIVSMASRLGWTVGITAEDLAGAQCRAVIKGEEENFLTVYRQGMAKLDEFLAHAAKPGPGQCTAGGGEFAHVGHPGREARRAVHRIEVALDLLDGLGEGEDEFHVGLLQGGSRPGAGSAGCSRMPHPVMDPRAGRERTSA